MGRKRGPCMLCKYLQVSSIETECQTATLCARRSTKGYSSHEQQLADPTNIGAHSNSFTISDQISFLCCRPPIAAALLPGLPCSACRKGQQAAERRICWGVSQSVQPIDFHRFSPPPSACRTRIRISSLARSLSRLGCVRSAIFPWL